MTQVTQSGYVREHRRYLKKSITPPLTLDYTSSPLEERALS